MKLNLKIVVFTFMILAVGIGYGTVYTALTGGTRDWSSAGDWSPTGIPTATDDVIIPSGAVMQLKGQTASINTLTVNSGGTLDLKTTGTQATLNINGDLLNNGTITSSTGSTASSIHFTSTKAHNISGTGTYTTTSNKPLNWTTDIGTTLLFDATHSLTGYGNFTLGSGSTIYTANPSGLDGSIALTTPTGGTGITLPTNTNYVFNGSGTQVTGTLLTTANNVTINGPSSLAFSSSTTIDGTLYNPNNTPFSGTVAVDGYDSPFVDIAESGVLISNFTTTSSSTTNQPTYIDRVWYIGGTTTAAKSVTYTWPDTEDNSYPWTETDPPSVYINGVEQTITSWTIGPPRTVTLSMSTFTATDVITIGRTGNQTLPIELSSFLVTISNTNFVTLQWITQSETNVAGFRIYRNTEPKVETATMLNVFVPATNTSQMQIYVVTDEEVYQDGIYYYWLENLDMDGSSTLHGPITINVTFNQLGTPGIPIIQGLHKCYPNPFQSDVNLELSMDKSDWIDMEIYNLRGQKIRSLYSGNMDKGTKTLHWDSKDANGRICSNGVYFAIMRTHGGDISKLKLTLVK